MEQEHKPMPPEGVAAFDNLMDALRFDRLMEKPSVPPGGIKVDWSFTEDEIMGKGAWLAYYPDRSCGALFETEVEALRHAVSYSMQVRFVPYGGDLWDSTGHVTRIGKDAPREAE